MAEIKLNQSFTDEVEAFRTSSLDIQELVLVNPISAGDLSLETVNAYQDRLHRIRGIMLQFRLLTQKDAKDMDDLATKLNAADHSCSW